MRTQVASHLRDFVTIAYNKTIYQSLANIGHFLLITIFVVWWWPKFSENSDQSSDIVAKIRRYYQLKRKLDGKTGKSIAKFAHNNTIFPHKILFVHLTE